MFLLMSFFKKLGETMKDTAASIGSKSVDMVEIGKLKLQRTQLEGTIKEKKTEIGDLIYTAQKQIVTVDTDALATIFDIINGLEDQIASIDEKLHKDVVQMPPPPASPETTNDLPTDSKTFCSKCGQELSTGSKFCNSCGGSQ